MFFLFFKLVIILEVLIIAAAKDLDFVYNGFASAAYIWQDGPGGGVAIDSSVKQEMSHTFYAKPVTFKNDSSSSSEAFSFSTTFVFAIRSQYKTLSGHGLAFVISPTLGRPGALPSQYLGLFNADNNGNMSNHVFAVELDTIQNTEFNDINDNHVGIDINGLISVNSAPAGYYVNNGRSRYLKNLTLISGHPMKVWVEYDGTRKQINVTLAPIDGKKPQVPLLSLKFDLSPILNQIMYVGFSASTGSITTFHYVLGWSFRMNGQAKELDPSQLPNLPSTMVGAIDIHKKVSKLLTLGVPVMSVSSVMLVISLVVFVIRRKKYAELLEDWELEYGPQRFKYEELYKATKGFGKKMLLGVGGFGEVYRGVLPSSKLDVAVKRVSHKSRQGMKEFVAEIVTLGRVRHRNLVQLLGYCRRHGELLLVYTYMPNGSLDMCLYNQQKMTLNWSQRFKIIKGVASGLLYLHEEWEQVVIHRDVKPSNVLLDQDLNGRLGDFGLAKLCDHGTDPHQTTHVAGTLGYLAPEHARTGRATRSTDVFAFGVFLLEVACGRRPIEAQRPEEDIILVDYVLSCWKRGNILEARDQNLGTDFSVGEMELVLKLALLCSHSQPTARPTMRQVMQYLEGDIALPELSLVRFSLSHHSSFAQDEGFDQDVEMALQCSYVPESTLLSGGR
ncbi:L-type lectin-domain containing receptor kinase IV.1-like [Argentina anserina]|uniref:L-type lectin-domain containing receptor kinase IV.1-like n=1 Tax=Argentina anserina TaxID=57926 RepID=UPI0021766936|nr:L-type lectin-domain containing receptor kinase IV.1-like [Potentilla anserina]